MTKKLIATLVLALPLAGYACKSRSPTEEAAVDRAEEAAEARARKEGYGPVDVQIQGKIARKRAELAQEVNREIPEDEPGLTAAQRLGAMEDGDDEKSGF